MRILSALYDVDIRTVNDYIQKIYADDELSEEVSIRNYQIVQTEITRKVKLLLDMLGILRENEEYIRLINLPIVVVP